MADALTFWPSTKVNNGQWRHAPTKISVKMRLHVNCCDNPRGKKITRLSKRPSAKGSPYRYRCTKGKVMKTFVSLISSPRLITLTRYSFRNESLGKLTCQSCLFPLQVTPQGFGFVPIISHFYLRSTWHSLRYWNPCQHKLQLNRSEVSKRMARMVKLTKKTLKRIGLKSKGSSVW